MRMGEERNTSTYELVSIVNSTSLSMPADQKMGAEISQRGHTSGLAGPNSSGETIPSFWGHPISHVLRLPEFFCYLPGHWVPSPGRHSFSFRRIGGSKKTGVEVVSGIIHYGFYRNWVEFPWDIFLKTKQVVALGFPFPGKTNPKRMLVF